MPNLPSGDGQNTKDQSLSVVLASDHDAVPIKSPDHSTDATFALAVWVGTIGGAALSTDAAPNTTPPAANRILRITAKRDGVMTFGGAQVRLLSSGDGTSIVVQPWFYDDVQALWVKHGAAITLTTATTNAGNFLIGNMAGAKFFMQITACTGVTALAYELI